MEPTLYVCTTTVIDPDTKLPVELEIRKCQDSGAMVGLDGSFLENTDELVRNPYNDGFITVENDFDSKTKNPLNDTLIALKDLLQLFENQNKEYLENIHDFVGEQPCPGCPLCKAREILKLN